MNHDQFWQLIEDVCCSDPYLAEEWDELLVKALVSLSANEIIEWGCIFDQLTANAYKTNLWAAAYLINGGASDDGFYYFRCWLVGMGKDIYNAAVADPDSLANVVKSHWLKEGIDAEAEIYGVARQAWEQVTGKSDDTYPVHCKSPKLVGEDWDFDDDNLMRKYLPRLSDLLK